MVDTDQFRRDFSKTKRRQRKSKPIPEYNGAALPQDLRAMTPEQVGDVMWFFLSLPLDELRRRQDIVHDLLKHVPANWRTKAPHLQVSVTNLNVQQGLLHCAVDRLAYPKDVPVDVVTHATSLVDFYTDGAAGGGWAGQDST